ncbi:sugar O-acyltransferase (sialic acid O-acetyltransferase NeuD family) [Chryseobacterium ginsenosidimutans]|uniref:acetyltransferase n=1 Tax=Chryseobacterium ginsenosidimutans TaxID=687846 RepID=UPI00277DBD22|nr:acetyltransferase [Chryseobacterium ginsenosidimutans]MDQ0593053.1 sugar O-acyltransferase (sialic acid O-acetyltransferase NeuD family) [Chryseobacterium ginsenosidimutans]
MYLFGASGHGKVVADIAIETGINITAFIDDNINKAECYGFPVIHDVIDKEKPLIITIGNNNIRKAIAEKIVNKIETLVHPGSIISRTSKIGKGTVVMGGVTVNADSYIGEHCIINTNSSIDHDCHLEDFVHISPNVALAGNIHVGEGSHIGIGASVIQNVHIGKWCVIGAGAVILKDVPDYSVVVGNPGRIIKKINKL